MILIIYFQTQSAKRVSRLLVIHPKHPEQIHRFAGHKQPIIIISSLPTAVITMHNAKRFLEDSAYVALYIIHPFFSHPKCSFEPSQEARATAEGNLKPDDLIAI